MPSNHEGFAPAATQRNLAELRDNPYPGRGIVLGVSPDGKKAVQAYWAMGRDEDSRNWILSKDNRDRVSTQPFDYTAMCTAGTMHLVSNGNQTDTVADRIANKSEPFHLDSIRREFAAALMLREYEPDDSHTARITGYMLVKSVLGELYGYSIIRKDPLTGGSVHTFGNGLLENIPNGAGVCLHTYQGDGNPLPPFEGTPYAVALENTAPEIAESFWEVLNPENRVAIVAKTMDRETGTVELHIINKLGETAVA